jgi:glycosyltransferase involved in cell wall biosynthesis
MLWPPEGSLALASTPAEPARAPAADPAPVSGNPLVRLRAHSVLQKERSLRILHFAQGLWSDEVGEHVVALLRGLPQHHRQLLAVLENEGPLRETVAGLGVVPREFRQGGARAKGVPAVGSFEQWLRESQIDVLHVHDVPSALVAMPAALRLGCQVVLDRMTPAPAAEQDRPRRAALRWLTRNARHVVADTLATRHQLVLEEGLPTERISVIPPGFDLARFDLEMQAGLRRPLPTAQGVPVIVHMGGMMDRSSREEDLLQALVQVRRGFPSVQAFLMGDGPRRPALELQARELGLSSGVHFLGYREDVPAVLSRARVAVRCCKEAGRSLSLVEGMAAGLPLVATAVGSIPELLAQGERGWLVPAESPDALAQALVQALEDPKRAALKGARARVYVARELHMSRLIAEHEALYRRLLSH